MLKRNEVSLETSCLNNAADDEPIFVLRANDDIAPDVVRMWALWYKRSKGGFSKMTERQIKKYHEAVTLSNDMDHWKDGQKLKELNSSEVLP